MIIGSIVFVLINLLIFGVIGWGVKVGIAVIIAFVTALKDNTYIGRNTIISIVEATAKWKREE